MNRKQKIQYFFDYYFVKIAVAAGLIFILGYLLWNYFRPQPEAVLYVAILEDDWNDVKQEELNEELNRMFGADGRKKRVVLDDSFHMADGGLDKLQVYLFNRQIDAVISDTELYRQLAGYGYYQDLSVLLGDESGRYEEQYLRTPGYREAEEISFEDHETGQGEVLPYGADISGSKVFRELTNFVDAPVFSVVQEAPNVQNALRFFEYLCR